METLKPSGGSSGRQHTICKRGGLSSIANGASDMVSSSFDVVPVKRPDDLSLTNGHERPVRSIEDLPDDIFGEILSLLPDVIDLARACAVNTGFRASSQYVSRVNFRCKKENVPRCTGQSGERVTPFKEVVMSKLKTLKCVRILRLEIEDGMQASRPKSDVGDKTSLWLTEDKFVQQWLPPVCATLKSLRIIDCGQQAIFQPTPLLQHLSNYCKRLEFLELRNLCLDCAPKESGTSEQSKPARLPGVTILTLRCVKLTANGLQDLNERMPNLKTLTLVTVVGLKDARFKSDILEVLCLGLATKVNSVKLEAKSLEKLQLKMACPDELTVKAPKLECLAVCMDKRPNAIVDFEDVKNLRELLMGASEFSTLRLLCDTNRFLEKLFVDVPCMAFEDNGGWKGVLPHVPRNLPDMKHIAVKCTQLHTLSVGPGLWYTWEEDMKKNPEFFCPTWPVLTRLILHLIVEEIDLSMKLLKSLVESIPTLKILEVYIHKDSKVDCQEFDQLRELFPAVHLKLDSWKKGLKFECFSF